MFKEIPKEEVVRAIFRKEQVWAIRINTAGVSTIRPIGEYTLQEFIDSTDMRFIVDDPESVSKEPRAEQTAVEADQNIEKADQSTPKAEQAPRQNKPGPKPVDAGKIKALHNAGWEIDAIAEEMHCSTATVKKYL